MSDFELDTSALAGLLGSPLVPQPPRLSHTERELLDHYTWLSFDEITWLLALAHTGDDGLTGSAARRLVKESDIGWLRLETCGFAKWERDLRGRLAYLVLTPKGEDFAEALVKASRPSSGYTWKSSPESN